MGFYYKLFPRSICKRSVNFFRRKKLLFCFPIRRANKTAYMDIFCIFHRKSRPCRAALFHLACYKRLRHSMSGHIPAQLRRLLPARNPSVLYAPICQGLNQEDGFIIPAAFDQSVNAPRTFCAFYSTDPGLHAKVLSLHAGIFCS